MSVTSPPLVDAEATRAWGARLGRMLRAGDLVILTGGLGAGKTTLTQGIAEGLGVRGPITSPTFVIARVHPSLVGGPALVHVDAYRLGGGGLGSADELDGLDLDADLDRSVTIVEWGRGVADDLAGDALDLTLEGESTRTVTVVARGERWASQGARARLLALADPPSVPGNPGTDVPIGTLVHGDPPSDPGDPGDPGTDVPIGTLVHGDPPNDPGGDVREGAR